MSTQPFDFSAALKIFDPEQIKATFAAPEMPTVNLDAAFETNRKNFAAMRAANATATEAYRSFYRKQMAIFEELMRAAKEQVDSNSGKLGPNTGQNAAGIYHIAMGKALDNMTKFAIATKQANEDAFAMIQERVQESIAELKSA